MKHNTGDTWDEIENHMTMPRLKALEAVWEVSPPMPRALSYLAQSKGFKVKKPRNKNVSAALELAEAIGRGG